MFSLVSPWKEFKKENRHFHNTIRCSTVLLLYCWRLKRLFKCLLCAPWFKQRRVTLYFLWGSFFLCVGWHDDTVQTDIFSSLQGTRSQCWTPARSYRRPTPSASSGPCVRCAAPPSSWARCSASKVSPKVRSPGVRTPPPHPGSALLGLVLLWVLPMSYPPSPQRCAQCKGFLKVTSSVCSHSCLGK